MSSDARIGIYSMESANNKYKSIHLELLSQWYIAGTETHPYRDVRNISWHNDNPDSMRIVVTFRSSVEVFEPVRLEIIGDP
ncbi:MAG: hypothetical protein QF495_08965, partial [SAR324 cluster bacterium]|nr:hypothetical protein [SAR324 cluster bacterium]